MKLNLKEITIKRKGKFESKLFLKSLYAFLGRVFEVSGEWSGSGAAAGAERSGNASPFSKPMGQATGAKAVY